MSRCIQAACAALVLAGAGALAQTATSSATMNTQAGSSSSSLNTLPVVPSAPSRPSRPSGTLAPGGAAEADAPASPAPSRGPATATTSIGGSGSAGLAAMGGGIDPGAAPATNQMGAGNLMTECPMGMVRHLGLCVTYAQARRAQQPKAPDQAVKTR